MHIRALELKFSWPYIATSSSILSNFFRAIEPFFFRVILKYLSALPDFFRPTPMSATKNQNTLNLKFVVVTNISSSPWRTQSSYFIDVGHWPNRHCADVYYLPYYPGPSNLSITSTTLLIFFDSYLKLSWGIHTYLVRWFMIWWKVKLSSAVLLKMHYQKLWDLIIDKYSLYAFCGFWVIFLRFPGIEAFFLRFRGFQAFILRFRGFQALFLRFCGFSNPFNPPPFNISLTLLYFL